ncbi:N-acetyltransferase family protein [Mycobacterium vicinigordonae]|uniref:GNAT family N-acetyltransferase n=1 Tax=Mycobacterium vicinigordonae TaxID=1719132 RepID=UPI003CCD6A6D
MLDTAISFETEVPTIETMATRIETAQARYEWLVLEIDGTVAGYAYASQFHSRDAYQWSVETSVYMAQARARAGGGRMLYAELLSRLAGRGFRRAFACIAHPHPASYAFHAAFGYEPVGHFRRVGWKLGTWHDVQWWQRDLIDADHETDPPTEIAASVRGQ